MNVVISPHLDDAAFSCGQWLAANPGATVVTVFAGIPEDERQSTDWDRRCGYESAGDAMQARRHEDQRALGFLQARPLWLDFGDSQYGQLVSPQEIALALLPVLRELHTERLVFPLGLFHSDHLLTYQACLQAMRELPHVEPICYEDALYRSMDGLLQKRLADLAHAGVTATPLREPYDEHMLHKKLAVQSYASQLRAFGPRGFDDVWRPERFWKLSGGVFELSSSGQGVQAEELAHAR